MEPILFTGEGRFTVRICDRDVKESSDAVPNVIPPATFTLKILCSHNTSV